MTKTAIDLRPFCAAENTMLPFSWGNHTYATNGFIAIRIRRMDDSPEREENKKILDIINHGLALKPPQWFPLPEITLEQASCDVCGGSGKVYFCAECEGEGLLTFSNKWNEYEATCESCGGKGRLGHQPSEVFEEEPCENCAGCGLITKDTATQLAGVWFTDTLLSKLAGLPGPVEIGPMPGDRPSHFRFTGGEGLIMPRSRQ
jgi:hypothetical protein